jgi:hypothetical protein
VETAHVRRGRKVEGMSTEHEKHVATLERLLGLYGGRDVNGHLFRGTEDGVEALTYALTTLRTLPPPLPVDVTHNALVKAIVRLEHTTWESPAAANEMRHLIDWLRNHLERKTTP